MTAAGWAETPAHRHLSLEAPLPPWAAEAASKLEPFFDSGPPTSRLNAPVLLVPLRAGSDLLGLARPGSKLRGALGTSLPSRSGPCGRLQLQP